MSAGNNFSTNGFLFINHEYFETNNVYSFLCCRFYEGSFKINYFNLQYVTPSYKCFLDFLCPFFYGKKSLQNHLTTALSDVVIGSFGLLSQIYERILSVPVITWHICTSRSSLSGEWILRLYSSRATTEAAVLSTAYSWVFKYYFLSVNGVMIYFKLWN